MKIRGKFKVTSITHRDSYEPYVEIELNSVYSNTPEDNSYSKATPSGQIKMTVTNPVAIESLPLGKSFYVDFSMIEEAPIV